MDTHKHFGLAIAYVIPGFIGLAGLAPLIPAVYGWLMPVAQGDSGLGPPIYALMGATAVGLVVSCFRHLLIDPLHHATGVVPPGTDFAKLADRIEGFDYLVQHHYRYFEFASNMLLSLAWAYSVHRYMRTLPFLGSGTDLGVVVLLIVLFAASRDALAKYYSRTRRLLGEIAEKGSLGEKMYNGIGHHEEAGGAPAKPIAAPKPVAKPESKSDKKPAEGKGKPPVSEK